MPVFDVRPPDAQVPWTPDDESEEALLGTLRVSARAESARDARAFVRRRLGARGIAAAIVDSAVLIVSELVTNAAQHGGDGVESEALIKLAAVDTRLRIEVHDASPRLPALCTASDDDEHGRGLAVVDALAGRWGWEPTADGKFVWCELATRQEQTVAQRA